MADIFQKTGSTLADNLMSKGLVGGAQKTLQDVGKRFTVENIAASVFSGDDIFSKSIKKAASSKKKKEESSKATKEVENVNSTLQSVLKNSEVLPNMAKDVSIIAQNMQQLVELNKPTDADFFRREDMEESQKESAGDTKPIQVKAESDEIDEAGGGEKKGGVLGFLVKIGLSFFLAKTFLKVFKSIFTVKLLLKALKKVFIPLTIIGSLFTGIKDGFDRYRETGKLSDAIFAGLGGVLEFLTLGFFGEDTLKNIFDNLTNFFEPVSRSIQKVFGGIKSFFSNLFGSDKTNDLSNASKDTGGEKPDLKPTQPEIPKNLGKQNIKEIRDNLENPDAPLSESLNLETTPTSYQPQQTQQSTSPDKKQALGNFMDNTGASQMLQSEMMPMMGNMKSGAGSMDPSAMAKKGFSGMFGNMGKGMGVDAGSLTSDLKSGAQGIKSSEDKQAGLMNALGNLASNPAIQNFRGKPSDEASRMENVKQASSGLDNLLGGAMSGMGIDTKSLQDQYGSKPMTPQSGSPSIYEKGGGSKGPSGGDINNRSSVVSEGQRMEAAASYGDVVNNSTTNNSKGSTQNKDRKIPEAVNKDLFLALNLGNQLPDTI